MTQQCAPEYTYDIRNRLTRVATSSSGAVDVSGHTDISSEVYVYTADNKRVSTVRANGNTAQVFYVYGAKSEIAAICTSQLFGGEPVCDPRQNFLPVTVDRVGSVAANPAGYNISPPRHYMPYGEQINPDPAASPFPGTTNFASYFHDQTTGLNYADQRFYSSTYGRFMSADPYAGSSSLFNPQSLNRYLYVSNDPVNATGPQGLCTALIGGLTQTANGSETSVQQ
ncbi:MAG: hypothetical protein M3Z09_09270, partial [Acidobacteriota bacterium]|nr:hypothetical protein [Acidobacteriota bacterium]